MLLELKTEVIKKDLDGIVSVLAIAIAFFLPLNQKIAILLIVLTGVFSIASWVLNGIQLPKKQFWPFPILFLLYLIGLFFTSNFDYGGSDIETRMTFVLFPLFYGVTKRKSPLPIRKIVLGLVLGCFIAIGFCYYYAGVCFKAFGYTECYEGVRLSFNMHPTYMALYMICASVFLWITYMGKAIKTYWKLLIILVSFIFMFMVYRLYSLGPWVGFMGMIGILGWAIAVFKKKLKFAIIVLVGACTIGVIAVQSLSFLKSDYENVKLGVASFWENPKVYFENNKNQINSVDSRIIIWMTSIRFISEHPMGVGTGDMRDELMNYYRQNGMHSYVERQLNPHCQYLQTSISIGVISALFLISILVYYIWIGFKQRNFYLIALVSLFAVSCFFESILERQWGILFFMFFIHIFAHISAETDELSEYKEG